MARFEAAVRSPIAFRRRIGTFAEDLLRPPDTVGIEFEGRLFVWHAFEPDVDPITKRPIEYGPSVTVVVDGDEDERQAADSLQRFLSTLAYYYDQPAEAISYGGSSESDPYWPAVLRAPRTHLGWMITEPYDGIGLRPEPLLRVAVAYYREGLSAVSPFYRFLSFWNSIGATYGDDRHRRADFINEMAPLHRDAHWDERVPFPDDPAKAFYDDSRSAIAHVVRDAGKKTIDPDRATDRVRIDAEASLLRWIARRAIESEYPNPITAGDHAPQDRSCA